MKVKIIQWIKGACLRLLVSLFIGFLFPSVFLADKIPFNSALFYKVGFTCSLVSYLIWEGNVSITGYFHNKYSWEDKAFKRLGYHMFIVLIYSNIVVIIGTYLMHLFLEVDQPEIREWIFIIVISSLISMLVLTIHERVYYFRNWVESKKETQELKLNYAEAQYNALKNQVNPHFLFNSLNTLSSIIHENPDKASEFVNKLSQVYRYILKSNENDLATIKDELKVAKEFLFLLKTRFEDDLIIDFNIIEGVEGFIPPMSLQLLIENAVKHNIVSPDDPLKVNISISEGFIKVTNKVNRKIIDANNSTKSGLKQIKKRYELKGIEGFVAGEKMDEYAVKLPIIKL